MTDKAIIVENISKVYDINKRSDTLTQSFGNLLKRKTKEPFWALKDISFEVAKGECLGVIGHNGAGKSTLLKILSKITPPTEGLAKIQGKVSSLLEVGTGFHPELTGRENIYLNGTLLGMTRKEIKAKLEEIIDFSGVEKFIDTPVKKYSSGMYVRLAFSVAANLDSDVLIIDEILAVGDADFQKKCIGKMDTLSRESEKTIILVSHNLALMRDICGKALLIANGELVKSDTTINVINTYIEESSSKIKEFKYVVSIVESSSEILINIEFGINHINKLLNVNFMNERGVKITMTESAIVKNKLRLKFNYAAWQSGIYNFTFKIKNPITKDIINDSLTTDSLILTNPKTQLYNYPLKNQGVFVDNSYWQFS